jgi:adenine-specific DNA-methyltransferase
MVLKNQIKKENTSIGQFFTPNYVAQFMIKNLLKKWNETNHNLTDIKNVQDLEVLEPSVGEGIFLKYLLQNELENITAYELDENLKESLLNLYPNVRFIFENFLSSDVNEKFDLIIGNPPYLGQNYNAKLFQTYVKDYKICDQYFVGNMDLFYYFIHLGIHKLKPGGILSFITTNYWITKSKKTGIKFLKPHIIDECFLLQYIDLSNLRIFKDATGQHNSIFVLQKKTEYEKIHNVNRNIDIIQIGKNADPNQPDKSFNKEAFIDIIHNNKSESINKYKSAISNKDLKREGSWNLQYPKEVKKIVNKIELLCSTNGETIYLKDKFLIRNGLILIKDDIFIVNKDKDLKIDDDKYSLKINGHYLKLNEYEKERLKKIYKSKSIRPYGFKKEDYLGYLIYFNKNEFHSLPDEKRNQAYEKKYPVLTSYLKQYEKELRKILINAKENPDDLYFPRRGAFIRKVEKNDKGGNLIDLEPNYDEGNKIFFKYISNKNVFGYTNSSYLATSDTYFLWPKSSEREINYLFIIAYLNSKLVHFLFKAKNITIKRSKTKLEFGIPLPNLNTFNSEKDQALVGLILFLASWLVDYSNNKINQNEFLNTISNMSYFSYFNQNELLPTILTALERKNNSMIQRLIDKLFFQLFDLNEDKIDNLLNKYYQF